MPGSRNRTSPHTWTAERVRRVAASLFGGESIVVLANRQPFQHDRAADGSVRVTHGAGGLVTALEPLVEACSGTWVAHASGAADRSAVDCQGRLNVPPFRPRYRLRRVWLDPRTHRGYYDGFANEGLWPFCHGSSVAARFREQDFADYAAANGLFARAACEEATSRRPLILVQDYHFALAPRVIRARLPLSTIVTFWHIPWPRPEDFRRCPWGRQLLEGLLASSIVGFQTDEDAARFLDTVDAFLDVRIDRSRQIVTDNDWHTTVRVYPASVPWQSPAASRTPSARSCRIEIRRRLGLAPDVRLVVGVDRFDYTKGLDEKVRVVERLLEQEPAYRGRLVLAQIAEPSRTGLADYQAYRSRVRETVRRVNARFGDARHAPIILLEEHHDSTDVYRFLRAADVCYVGSLHDGMNLVAKEFVAARHDERGVLILSEFAGAARELGEAVLVNPSVIDDGAAALAEALRMPAAEQAARMRAMRSVVAESNAHRWAADMLLDAARLRGAAGSPLNEYSPSPRPQSEMAC